MKESDGRNLKMANRRSETHFLALFCIDFFVNFALISPVRHLRFLPSDSFTKMDFLTKVTNEFSKILMLRKALMALSNVVNKLSDETLCQPIVIPCN